MTVGAQMLVHPTGTTEVHDGALAKVPISELGECIMRNGVGVSASDLLIQAPRGRE